ncbi:MAG: DMT family transporter [Boseongicola sp.]|nr:DMT family transporter [Boseongicola sp.]
MTSTVFIAVIGAALLHAAWNAIVKGGADKPLSMGAVVIGHIPPASLALYFVPAPAVESLPYLICGIALHFGYQIFLLRAYQTGDLTQVYPLARGSAPLLVALFSVLVLGVHLENIELLAIAIIGLGIISLTLVRRSDGLRNPKAAVFALITGVFIASYSLVDGQGARVSGSSVGFFAWIAIANGLLMVLFLSQRYPNSLKAIPKTGMSILLLGGGASFVAYGVVTWAFTQAPIALVTALRETSIVFALLIGVVFLKERLDLLKVFSTAMTLIGALLLRFAR